MSGGQSGQKHTIQARFITVIYLDILINTAKENQKCYRGKESVIENPKG